jgi:transposase
VKDHAPPPCCPDCGGSDLEDAGVFRWQVVEVPEIRPRVTEHRVHKRRCRRCGVESAGELPPEVARSNFGPRTHALAAALTGGFRLTRREAVRFFDEVLHVDLSTGALSTMEGRVAAALEYPYRVVARALREGGAAHIDETPWKERRIPHWLWNATFGKLAVFRIDRRRDRAASRRLFAGKFHGTRIVDRYSVHDDVKAGRRQVCWAHLDRDFAAFVEGPVGRRRFGRTGRAVARGVFRSFDLFEAGRIDRARLRQIASSLKERVRRLLTDAEAHPSRRVRRFAKHLLRQIDACFVYAGQEGVSPTNNASERALRGPVLWRKGSYGTQSARGSRFAERILTAKHCLRAQGRDVLAFLVEAIRAHVHALTPPSLLPPPST